MVKLSEVSKLITKGTTPTIIGGKFVDRGVNFIKVESITDSGEIDYNKLAYIDEKVHEKLARSQIKEGDVLLSIAGDIGRCAVANTDVIPANTNQAVAIIRLIDDIILPEYLKYHFRLESSKRALLLSNAQSIQSNVNLKNVGDYQISVPNIAVQKKIVSQLSMIDDLIQANKKIIETSEKLMREIYDYWFVQFDYPDKNGRPYKSSGGEMVYDEKLKREIPKGWKVVELGDIIKEAKKSSIQVNEAKENAGEYPFFTSGDGILAFDDYYVDEFNIFLNTGGNADVKAYYGKSAYSSDTWCISANEYSYMLYIFLDIIKDQINNNCFAGSGLKHLQKNAFKKIKLAVPEEDLLKSFNDLAQPIYQAISSYKVENKKLASLRDWLLPMLMNGQVKISDNRNSYE